MLRTVEVGGKNFIDYRETIGWLKYEEIRRLTRKFQGKRILNINATELGGGVAQILHSLVPLSRGLGIDMHWQVMQAPMAFFEVTKQLHNSLQGDKRSITKAMWKIYELQNQLLAADIKPADWDYIIIHDPQPAAAINYLDKGAAKWVWRCHIDLSRPNQAVKDQFLSYLKPYDGAVFTLEDYVFKGIGKMPVAFIPVAIDPLVPKNQKLDHDEALAMVSGLGVNVDHPLIVQISRFDPWKDPIGVIEAWRLAKKRIPDLQLVLMGDAASDDPEGKTMLATVMEAAEQDEGIFIITTTNDEVVNALQTVANVVLQKSLREGFGLTVAEALWSGTPVIGGNVGGIPTQIKPGKDGYLVNSVPAAAKRIVELVQNPLRARRMGQWGHEYVRQHFLLPQLLYNELKFLRSLSTTKPTLKSRLTFMR